MANTLVFQDNQEIDRLAVQNRLLKTYEKPVFRRLLSGRSNLKVLDVGCNDGSKTVDWFSCPEISQVIGLEYHRELARKAQHQYGGERFAFYPCDVEASDFPVWLSSLMVSSGVEGFDIIYVSFLLMHLKKPEELLRRLRRVLAPGGRLVVVEADDTISEICPDPHHLLRDFLNILSFEPLSGDRTCGGRIPALLADCGYGDIAMANKTVGAGAGEGDKKRAMFDVFFSYLPQDLCLLREKEPDNSHYAACAAWLERHYEELRNLIVAQNSKISMGISMITCLGE